MWPQVGDDSWLLVCPRSLWCRLLFEKKSGCKNKSSSKVKETLLKAPVPGTLKVVALFFTPRCESFCFCLMSPSSLPVSLCECQSAEVNATDGSSTLFYRRSPLSLSLSLLPVFPVPPTPLLPSLSWFLRPSAQSPHQNKHEERISGWWVDSEGGVKTEMEM